MPAAVPAVRDGGGRGGGGGRRLSRDGGADVPSRGVVRRGRELSADHRGRRAGGARQGGGKAGCSTQQAGRQAGRDGETEAAASRPSPPRRGWRGFGQRELKGSSLGDPVFGGLRGTCPRGF